MYTIGWEIPEKALIVELSPIVTAKEMQVVNQTIIEEYLDKSHHPIYIIVSGAKVKRIPVNIGELNAITRKLAAHPKIGHSIYINMKNPVLNFVANAVTRSLGHHYTIVKTLDDALKLVQKLETN